MEQTQPITEADVMKGTIMDTPVTNNVTDTMVDQIEKNLPNASTNSVEDTSYIVGNKKFGTKAEADAHVIALEAQIQMMKSMQNPTQQIQAPTEEDYSQILFEDPNKYTRLVKQQAKQEIRQEYLEAEARKSAWNDFYESNTDLKNFKEVVEYQTQKLSGVNKDKPVTEALEAIAKETRAFLRKTRGEPSGHGTEMPKGSAVVAGSSGSPMPKAAPVSSAPMSFSDQIRALGRKKK